MFTKMSRVVMSRSVRLEEIFKKCMFYVYMWFLVFLYGNCIDFFNKNFKIFFLFLKSFIEIYFT